MKNLEKFLLKNPGKTESDYREWATNCGKAGFESRMDRAVLLALAQCRWKNTFGASSREEYHQNLVQYSKNPLEIMQHYLNLHRERPDEFSKGFVIETFLQPFPKKDYERWGDKNNMRQVARKWFDANGVHLDVQCIALCEYFNNEITEEDVIEHITSEPYRTENEKWIQDVEQMWKATYGFKITREYAEGILHPKKVEVYDNVPF